MKNNVFIFMKKKQNKLEQEVFNFFQPLNEWPKSYYKDLNGVSFYEDNVFGMDIETEGLNPYDGRYRVISVGLSPSDKISFASYVLNEWNTNDWDIFRSTLSDPNVILVGHNIKYDVNWLAIKFGLEVKCMLFDTMFAQYLLDENVEHNSLEAAIDRYISDSYLKGYKKEVNRDDLKRMAKEDELLYNCKDADASRRLYDVFVPKLREGGYEKLMITSSMVLPVLSKMEVRGVYLDKEYAYKTQTKLFSELVQLRYSMAEIVQTPFDPDSYQSLGNVLYKKLGFTPTKFTEKGSPSTDGEAISYLVDQATDEKQNRFIERILEYKKKLKLITTYYQPIERWTKYDGRVHTNYSLGRQRNEEGSGGTVTGRLSSNNPNLQNIPRGKEHRGMFAATKNYTLLDGDFSQLELRVAAFLSQEPVMMEAFANNLDIHTAVMSDLQGIPYDDLQATLKDSRCKEYERTKNDRVAIKRINFGILYGVQARRLQRLLRIELGIQQELGYCRELITKWLNRYKSIAKWIESQKIQAASFNFVTMPLGQRRRLPQACFEKTREAAHSLAQATNFPVQSLASWICLIGLRLLDDYFIELDSLGVEGHILMQVHDSVTSEIKKEWQNNLITLDSIKVDVKRIMEVETLNYLRDVFGVEFNCPLVFDVEYKERWS